MSTETHRARIALLVLGEDGTDPRDAFLSAQGCAPRYYAQIRAAPRTEGTPRGVLPDDVSVVVAPTIDAAVSHVVTNCGGDAVLIMNAGESLTLSDAASDVPRRVRATDPAAPAYAVWRPRLRVTLASGSVRDARWFPGRQGRIVATRLAGSSLPPMTLARRGAGIGDILPALRDAALGFQLSTDRFGALRLLLTPGFNAVRVFAAGAWRSGFRGFLFASLHGLFWLIVLTRTWLRPQIDARSANE